MIDITILLVIVTAVYGGSMLAVVAVGILHEQWARGRERRAIERHEKEMKELETNNRTTLAAITQRSRIEERTGWLEEAIRNHGEHLEEMGRTDVAKDPPPRL